MPVGTVLDIDHDHVCCCVHVSPGVISEEPPVSPYGFPPPPEILALKPGKIFSIQVRLLHHCLLTGALNVRALPLIHHFLLTQALTHVAFP